jgi:large-conductance mechanosensitive channel
MKQIKNNNDNNHQLINFTKENMGTASGVILALASKDLIYSFVNDLLLPLINKYLFTLTAHKFDIKTLFVNLITWMLVIINTYLFYTLLFND